MYFPIGWPKELHINHNEDQMFQYICSNRDRILFAVLTLNSVTIWYCKPCLQIVCHRRSDNAIAVLGTNCLAEWKPDSSMLAVTTSKDYIMFYNVTVENSSGGDNGVYTQRDSKNPTLRRESAELFIKEVIPNLQLQLSFSLQMPGRAVSLVCIRDEMMVSTGDGEIVRVKWDGSKNNEYSLQLSSIPFSIDQQQSRASLLEDSTVYITHIEYSPVIGGFAVVLSNGKAAFITAPTLRFEPSQVQGIWAQGLTDASCVSINHKYRLIAYGCNNAQGIVYCIDDMTGSLQVSHRLILSSKDYPDVFSSAGPVIILRWTPDNCAVAMAWKNGGVSVWSVFGSLLVCTLGWDYGFYCAFRDFPMYIISMEWGSEGYQLWIMCQQVSTDTGTKTKPQLLQLPFAKSVLTVNPCMSNHEHLFLQSEDRLLVNTGDPIMKTFRPMSLPGEEPHSLDSHSHKGSSMLMGNKQWHIIEIPFSYLGNNWPIRYAAIDKTGQFLAVAGKTGFAHFMVATRKWKLFGNVTQEKDMVVTGGLSWWRDYIVMGCYNLLDSRDEIRFYPKSSNVDNAFAYTIKVLSQVLLLNLFRDILIAFCADSHITLYSVVQKNNSTASNVEMNKLQDITILNLIPHPVSIISITLTSVRTETACRGQQQSKEAESILINVAGKLIMIQGDQNSLISSELDKRNKQCQYATPVMLASCVENMWASNRSCRDKPHLMEALWIGCGAQGMKVWLPLFPRDGEKTHHFMSKRIMLPFQLQIYPLAVLFENAVVLGAENDVLLYEMDVRPSFDAPISLPFCVIERTSQVYLHHILRQLLRRNLGFHALEIARSCNTLPYFPHCLELLLHQVLEEEATSSEPIPDPLLPRVVAFIQEFPEFLQTVVHCARKTEIALWPHLFATVGKPKDLFQECLQKNHLDTGASYLIILQNLETLAVSRQYATLLLDSALDHGKWKLAKDIIRFLSAIDPRDAESPPRSPLGPLSTSSKFTISSLAMASASQEADAESLMLLTGVSGRPRSVSINKVPNQELSRHKDLKKTLSNENRPPLKKRLPHLKEGESADNFFIEVIVSRHAKKLLLSCQLRELGNLVAHLDFHFVTWLRKERLRAARVEDFVHTLKKLHEEFQWPYPVLTQSLTHYIHRLSSASSSSRLSLKDVSHDLGGLVIQEDDSSVSCPDNGYHSNPSLSIKQCPALIPGPSDLTNGQIMEAFLTPQQIRDDLSLATTEISENSSFCGEGDLSLLDDNIWNSCRYLPELEQITQELANKGPQQSEIELRYFLQMMLEASCLEWSMLIAIILRDMMAVTRIINIARQPETQIEMVVRLKEGLEHLNCWVDTECLGYKPFLHGIRSQSMVLNKILASASNPEIVIPQPSVHSENSVKDSSGLDDNLFQVEELDEPMKQSEESTCVIS